VNAAVHNYLFKAEMKLDSFSERMESFYTRMDLFQTRSEQAENERRQSESHLKLALDTAVGEIRRVEGEVAFIEWRMLLWKVTADLKGLSQL